MKRALPILALTLFFLAGPVWTSPEPVGAKEFIVDSYFDDPDAHDADLDDCLCADSHDACTLRAAIEQANACYGPDIITFQGPMQILVHSGNFGFSIDETVTIDASTVWDKVNDRPGIVINGRGGSFHGLSLSDDSCQVYGLEIIDFDGSAIDIRSAANTIGGVAAGQRNVLSGNLMGISISGATAHDNVVRNNYVGTKATGDAPEPNDSGIVIAGGAKKNIIGGSDETFGNRISGNTSDGVVIEGNGTDGNRLGGNLIGTDSNLADGLGNGGYGVRIHRGAGQTIVGGSSDEANAIAYNGSSGVFVSEPGSDTQVSHNIIGGNKQHGIHISNAAGCVVSSNLIYGNALAGVGVFGASSAGNLIWPNSITRNVGKGILLGPDANMNMLPPTVQHATSRSARGTSLCSSCTIALYSDDGDEGYLYHGTTTADGIGNWTYAGPLFGPNITATVIDIGGNTSEFSVPFDISGFMYAVYVPQVRR